jgi:VWFA-related protein
MSDLSKRLIGVHLGRVPLLGSMCLLWVVVMAFSQTQQPPQQAQPAARSQRPTFEVESDLVVVDAVVRDRKGNLVGDLTKNDFKIYEDNVPQELVTFSLENIPLGPPPASAPPASTPADAATTPTVPVKPAPAVINLGLNPDAPPKKEDLQGKRLVILFFDLSSLGTEDLIRSVDTAHSFIERQAGPQDLVAVATYNNILELVQDFTNDKDLLLKTLNAISSPDSGDAVAADLSDPDTSDDVFVPDTMQFNIFNTDRRLSALETLAKMYRAFPERKSLLYFSSGVTTTGVENNAQIRSTVDNANRSNMSIYTVDSRGLVALPPGGGASARSPGGRGMYSGAAMMRQRTNLSSSQETLTTLSHDTGGQAFTDSNDLSLALKQVQNDTHIYYVLGYFSTNPKQDGKYRKIRVEVSRPDLKVEHRPGYFASKAFSQLNQQERDLQLQQAMSVERPFADVPVILQADYFRMDNNTSLVPISIELDGDGLKFEDKGANKEGKFEFVAQVSDTKGRVTGVARDAVQVRLPAEKAEKLKSGGIFYSTGFQLKPGEYKLKFLVRDNGTGKLGGFEQPISVPALDLKKLDTSSIVLGNQLMNARAEAGSGVAHQGMMRRFQELGIGYDPLVIGNQKVVPSIGNIFLNRQTVYVFFQVYGATPDSQSQKPWIETYLMLLKDNTKILESQPEIVQDWTKERALPGGMGGRGGPGMGGRGDRGGMGGPPGGGGMRGPGGRGLQLPLEDRKGEATVAISLPLKSLKKGTYTLQVHVRDLISDTNIFRRVPIVIK